MQIKTSQKNTQQPDMVVFLWRGEQNLVELMGAFVLSTLLENFLRQALYLWEIDHCPMAGWVKGERLTDQSQDKVLAQMRCLEHLLKDLVC